MSEDQNPLDPLDQNLSQKEDGTMIAELLASIDESHENKNTEKDTETVITGLDSLVLMLHTKEYNHVRIEPEDQQVKVVFVKEAKDVLTHFISFAVYTDIILKLKTISSMNLAETKKIQEGNGEYKVQTQQFKIIAKVAPSEKGEKAFLKVKELEQIDVIKKKKKIPLSKLFGFLGAALFVSLILGGVFITSVVLNAKTVEDVKFFYSLGINLNDINTFISKVVTFIFSLLIFIEALILSIFLFKFLLTKKAEKRKKTTFFILSLLLIIATVSTATGWVVIEKKIRGLPNWQEVAYGDIQLFDNSKLLSDKFDKGTALITDTSRLIGPITIKYDLSLFENRENAKGLKIQKYLWDFGDGDIIEGLNPSIIHTFEKKGVYNVSLNIEETDTTGKLLQKKVEDVKPVSINNLVKVTETLVKTGGKQIEIDASDLKELGQIEWFFEEDLDTPVWKGEVFRPAKIFYDDHLIAMVIRDNNDTSKVITKVFVVQGADESGISGKINYEIAQENDRKYTFYVQDIENDFGAGFIKQVKWSIDGYETLKPIDITDIEGTSKITSVFSEYGSHKIRATLTDTSGKEKTFTLDINAVRTLQVQEGLLFYSAETKIDDVGYNEHAHEYSLYDLGIPTKLKIDARNLKLDNILYTLKSVQWDIGNDGDIDEILPILNFDISTAGKVAIRVDYVFDHIKKGEESIRMSEYIYIESVKKDAILDLKIEKDSEYVPVTVRFDASRSEVKEDNIVKFIYDYGDGTREERDAINPGHKYIKEGNYIIKLTVLTTKGKEYSTEKSLILKPKPQTAKITVSMKNAPPKQEIDFSSSDSEGQVVSYFWKFGDGFTSTDSNPSHAYEKPGKYEVVLKVGFINNNYVEDKINIDITE